MPSQRAHEMLPILVDHRRATAWPLTGRKPRASALTRTATRPTERQDHFTVTPAQQPPRPRHRAEPPIRRTRWSPGSASWGSWLAAGGPNSEGGGVLGDQGAEALQQLQQQGELLVAVAGRQLRGPLQEVVEEAEGLVGPVLGGFDEGAAAGAGVGVAAGGRCAARARRLSKRLKAWWAPCLEASTRTRRRSLGSGWRWT